MEGDYAKTHFYLLTLASLLPPRFSPLPLATLLVFGFTHVYTFTHTHSHTLIYARIYSRPPIYTHIHSHILTHLHTLTHLLTHENACTNIIPVHTRKCTHLHEHTKKKRAYLSSVTLRRQCAQCQPRFFHAFGQCQACRPIWTRRLWIWCLLVA